MAPPHVQRVLTAVLGYGVLYGVLAVLGAALEFSQAVPIWVPLAGLDLAVLVLFGLAYLPLVFAVTLGMGLWTGALPVEQTVLLSMLITAAHGVAAAWLRGVRTDGPAPLLRFAGRLAGMALLLGAFISGVRVLLYVMAGLPDYTWDTVLTTSSGWWLAHAIGYLTILPLLVLAAGPYLPGWAKMMPLEDRLWPARDARSMGLFILEVGSIALALVLAVALSESGRVQFYVCLLPIFWLAWLEGLPRTVLAAFLVNASLGVFLATQGQAAGIAEAQVFMVVLALTALFAGAIPSTRRQTLATVEDAYTTLEQHLEARTAALTEAQRTLTAHIAERAHIEASLHDSVADLRASRDELAAAIKDQEALNEKLRTSEQQLRDLNARKDKFFSIVSHDVKNMLISSIGFSKLLISDADTLPREMIKEFASHVHSSTTNTYDLLENLLTWARMQTGRMPSQRAWHSVNDLVHNNIAMLTANAARKGIDLVEEVEREVQIYADRNMINSVLQNLISNAIKFTERGGRVTVSTRAYDSIVEISVIDTGVGINPEVTEKLFRIDAHHSSAGTEDEEGTGLGLVLCKEMVIKHDGEIWVESEEGNGSAFRFTLPCAEPATVDEHAMA